MGLRIRSIILLVALLPVIVACGGGSSSTSTETETETSSSSSEIALGSSGKLLFPESSLPANTVVTVKAVPLPYLTNDIIPLGVAYQVGITNTPSLPTKVTLPIPVGEDPSKLILIRLEENGRITLLQTSVENGMLVALTPGFSRIMVVRLEELLDGFSPSIIGPDILPTNIAGQYSEQTLSAVSGVQSQWRLAESVPHQLIHNRRFATATLSVEKAGLYNLTAEFAEATTGLNVFAYKYVNILDTLEAGDQLDIAIHGPSIITEGELFNLSSVVLNTDITETISSWSWTMGSQSGSCESECSIRFDLRNRSLSTLGTTRFSITGVSDSGISGSAFMDIKVLEDAVRIIRLTHIPDDSNAFIDDSSPPLAFTLTTELEYGTPPYTYEWFLNDKDAFWENSIATHVSWQQTDSIVINLDQPGSYEYMLYVTDSHGKISRGYGYISPKGALPVEFHYEDLPTTDVVSNQPVTITLTARGGVLAFNGYQFNSYDYLIDWGDGTLESNKIPATNPFDGGSITLSHTYTTPGSYTVEYVASPTRSRDFLNLDTLSPFIDTTITVIANAGSAYPTAVVCPQTISSSYYGTSYAFLDLANETRRDFDGNITGYKSTCNYSLGSDPDLAAKIYIGYGPDVTTGCSKATDSRFILIADHVIYDRFSNTAWSTKRTISTSYVGWGQTPRFDNPETILANVVDEAVVQTLGETCPST